MPERAAAHAWSLMHAMVRHWLPSVAAFGAHTRLLISREGAGHARLALLVAPCGNLSLSVGFGAVAS